MIYVLIRDLRVFDIYKLKFEDEDFKEVYDSLDSDCSFDVEEDSQNIRKWRELSLNDWHQLIYNHVYDFISEMNSDQGYESKLEIFYFCLKGYLVCLEKQLGFEIDIMDIEILSENSIRIRHDINFFITAGSVDNKASDVLYNQLPKKQNYCKLVVDNED